MTQILFSLALVLLNATTLVLDYVDNTIDLMSCLSSFLLGQWLMILTREIKDYRSHKCS